MTLAIVAYPDLSGEDLQTIEAFRAAHDPHAGLIAVHFTLVFPVEASTSGLAGEMLRVARETPAIRFGVSGVPTVVADPTSRTAYVFLVPEGGRAEVTHLHDSLYANGLQPYLRPEVPFVPHMTIGRTQDIESANRLALSTVGRIRAMRGTLTWLHLVEVADDRVRVVCKAPLGGSRPGASLQRPPGDSDKPG